MSLHSGPVGPVRKRKTRHLGTTDETQPLGGLRQSAGRGWSRQGVSALSRTDDDPSRLEPQRRTSVLSLTKQGDTSGGGPGRHEQTSKNRARPRTDVEEESWYKAGPRWRDSRVGAVWVPPGPTNMRRVLLGESTRAREARGHETRTATGERLCSGGARGFRAGGPVSGMQGGSGFAREDRANCKQARQRGSTLEASAVGRVVRRPAQDRPSGGPRDQGIAKRTVRC